MKTLCRVTTLVLSLLALSVLPAFAQEHEPESQDETKAEVPALTRFHTPIYKLWHTAWPNKDTAMLASLVPDIEAGVAEVAAAELPGILRDKKEAWDTNVKKLKEIAAEYESAAGGVDQQRMLDAAEKLHAQYETLVRVVRPPMKQIDAFHSVLYMIYHYYMPEWNMPKLKTSVAELKVRMDTLKANITTKKIRISFFIFSPPYCFLLSKLKIVRHFLCQRKLNN
jgi:hypothetical protein